MAECDQSGVLSLSSLVRNTVNSFMVEVAKEAGKARGRGSKAEE